MSTLSRLALSRCSTRLASGDAHIKWKWKSDRFMNESNYPKCSVGVSATGRVGTGRDESAAEVATNRNRGPSKQLVNGGCN